jgi:hypothetical protein
MSRVELVPKTPAFKRAKTVHALDITAWATISFSLMTLCHRLFKRTVSVNLTIEWLHCKLQTRPLVREGAPQKETANFRQQRSDRKHNLVTSSRVCSTPRRTDWLTVSRKVISTSNSIETQMTFLYFFAREGILGKHSHSNKERKLSVHMLLQLNEVSCVYVYKPAVCRTGRQQ